MQTCIIGKKPIALIILFISYLPIDNLSKEEKTKFLDKNNVTMNKNITSSECASETNKSVNKTTKTNKVTL